MFRVLCATAGAVAMMSCATEQKPLPAALDPANPDAPEAPPALATAIASVPTPAPEPPAERPETPSPHSGHASHGDHDTGSTDAGSRRAEPAYTCPMHPEVRAL